MTTPRIEEQQRKVIANIKKIYLSNELDGIGLVDGWNDYIMPAIKQALTEAHQAGIDEAVKVAKAHYYTVNVDKQPTIQDEAWANQYDSKAEAFWYGEAKGLEALDDTIKALQDNK